MGKSDGNRFLKNKRPGKGLYKSLPLVFFVLMLAIIPDLAFPQASSGFKAGAGLFSIHNSFSNTQQFAWQAGFFSQADLSDHFTLQPELDYAERRNTMVAADSSVSLILRSVNLRFLGFYRFNDHFLIGAGPYFGYILQAKQSPVWIDKSWFNPFCLGLNAAATLQFYPVMFSLRYDTGLTLLTRDNATEVVKTLNPFNGSHTGGLELIVSFGF